MSDEVRRRDKLGVDRIGREVLSDGRMVSTVRLICEHSFAGEGGFWFETMVFSNEHDFSDLECVRYRTRAEAVAGHALMVERCRADLSVEAER